MASSAACVSATEFSVAFSFACSAACLAPVTLRNTAIAYVAFALALTLAAIDDCTVD